jgi:hypothetical protein
MQIQTLSSGGFVIHKITGYAKNTISAWYDKQGKLLDSEYVFTNKSTTKVGKAHTSVLAKLHELGQHQALLLQAKPNLKIKEKSSKPSVRDIFEKLIEANSKVFKPAPVVTLLLANGQSIHIEQCNEKGHYRVKANNSEGYATTLENAYKNMEYQAKLSHNHKHPETFGRSEGSREFFNGLKAT